MTITLGSIRAAAAAIEGSVVRTPTVHSRTLSEICGATVFLKLENLQYTASFKDRGALVKLLALSPAERRAGVVAMSAGNHAQAVAYHATRLGIAATIVMPKNTPFLKIANTQKLGATVVLDGLNLSEAGMRARAIADAEGRAFVHPYDDDAIISGQGTIALEMLADEPRLDALVVPVGGGGLLSGIATAARALQPGIELVGVQAALCPSMYQALRGETPTLRSFTIAEGIAVKDPGRRTRAILADLGVEVVLANEATIEHAVQLIAEIEKLVAEGAGAAPLAAVLEHRARFAGRRIGLVLSGGNIDARLLASVLMRGLVRSGRLIRLRVEVSDLPGSLAQVTRLIAEHGGNIVELEHERWFYDVPVRLTEIDVLVETSDPGSGGAIVKSLAAAGYPVKLLSNTAENGGH
jgi:threonine dehydratase